MDVPLEKEVAALLRQGNVFYFVEPSYPTDDPHNFVLLNHNPSNEKKLIFVGATSQVANAKQLRQSEPPETLIVVQPTEYRDFTRETLFDCNDFIERTFAELLRLVQNERRVKLRDHIGDAVLRKLVKGVLASRLIPPRIKKEVDPDYSPPTETRT